MTEDRTQAEWNQNEAILKRIDALTNSSIETGIALRSDARNCLLYLDYLKSIWDEINAVASMEDNARTYHDEITEVRQAFNELYSLASREVKKAQKKSSELQTRGANPEFLSKSAELKTKIIVLAQRFGFGMSTKRFSNYDLDSSMRHALE